MAGRIFESYPWVFAFDHDFVDEFAERQERGWRVETISMDGGDNPTLAVTWLPERASAPPQRLSRLCRSLEELFDDGRQAEHEGFAPALITGDATHGDRLLVVYEPAPPDLKAPTLLQGALSWHDFEGQAHSADSHRYLRSAVALRADTPEARPRFFGTVWPYAEGERFDWGVTYWYQTALEHPFVDDSPRAKAMAVAGRPFWVSASVDYLPAEASPPGQVASAPRQRAHRALAIWRDQFMKPWPERPFDPAARRHREIVVDFVHPNDVAERRELREARGFELLSLSRAGGWPPVVTLNWSHGGTTPLQKQFHLRGRGDLRSAVAGTPHDRVPPEGDEAQASGAEDVPLGSDRARPGPLGSDDLTGLRTRRAQTPRVSTQVPDPADLGRGGRRLLHPLDRTMRELLVETGIRCAQLCVLRRGRLAFERTYTNAEQGYPIADDRDRFRIGSVAKAMTSLAIVRHYHRLREQDPGDPGLDRSFGGELGIQRVIPEPAFDAVTIRQALQHTTGLDQRLMSYDAIVELLRPEELLGLDADGEPLRPAQPRPGDMTDAFANWPTPLVTRPPGTVDYNNYVYLGLSELWSTLVSGNKVDYDRAIRSVLAPEMHREVLSGEGYEACSARREVAYHPARLAISRSSFSPGWTPEPYNFGTQFSAGSGGWGTTMTELARILARLTPVDGREPVLTQEEKWVLAYGTEIREGQDVARSLGWLRGSTDFVWMVDGVRRTERQLSIVKNGLAYGASSWIAHWMPPRPVASGPLPDETRTLDILVAFNHDGPSVNPGIVQRFYAAIQETELLGLWAPVDLFEDSGLNE